MDAPIVITFYADPPGETWYSRSAKRFAESCERLGIQHDVRQLAASVSWLENTRKKAAYVVAQLKHYKRDLLWVDVDTEMVRCPVYAWDRDSDFAAVKFDGKSKLDPPLLIRSTAMWFGYTKAAVKLAETWAEKCKTGRYGDHREISNLLHTFPGKVSYMPPAYAHATRRPDSVMVMGMAMPVQSRAKEMKEIANEIATTSKA